MSETKGCGAAAACSEQLSGSDSAWAGKLGHVLFQWKTWQSQSPHVEGGCADVQSLHVGLRASWLSSSCSSPLLYCLLAYVLC